LPKPPRRHRGTAGGDRLPIIIPLLDDMEGADIDELDEHLLLLEAARHRLDSSGLSSAPIEPRAE